MSHSQASKALHIDKIYSTMLLNGTNDFYPQVPRVSPALDVYGGGKIRKSFCVQKDLYVNGNIILDGQKLTPGGGSNLSSNVLICNVLCALKSVQTDVLESKSTGNIIVNGNIVNEQYIGGGVSGAIITDGGVVTRGNPCFPMDNAVFVAKNGNDTTGDGSVANPYLTVQHAINQAYLSASKVSPVTTRCVVWVMPGTYTENLTMKANVFVRGLNQNTTRLIGNWTIDSTFAPPMSGGNDARTGFNEVFISGTGTVDFAAYGSNEGKVMAYNTRFGSNITFTGFSSINQALYFGCEFFGDMTITGMVTECVNCIFQNPSSTITLNYSMGGGNSFWQCGGCRCNLVINSVAGTYNVQLEGAVPTGSTVLINGASGLITSSASSLPIKSSVSFSGGASQSQITRENDAFGAAYVCSNLSDWSGVQPSSIADALDRIAAKIQPIP